MPDRGMGTCFIFLPPNVLPTVLPRIQALAQEWPGQQPVVCLVATKEGVRRIRLGVRVQPTEQFQDSLARLLRAGTVRGG